MRRIGTVFCSLLLSALLLAPTTRAQPNPQDLESLDELSSALQVLGSQYADRYVQPVSDALGSGMHAGLFRTAEVGGGIFPVLDVYVGVSVSGALMASSDKSFSPNFQETIQSSTGETLTLEVVGQADRLPTAFGSTEPPNARLSIKGPNGNEVGSALLPPGLVDTPIAPLIVPQVGIGSLLGTDVQLRYLPETRLYQYGTVGLFGVAVRHSLTQYIPASPLSISVQGAWNSATLGTTAIQAGNTEVSDVLDAQGWAFNLQASKSLPLLPVTFYGGLQYEKFNTEYSYVFDPSGTADGSFQADPIELSLDQEATNTFRGLAGVSITLAVVRLNVDYAIAANDALTFGLGVKL